MVSSAVQISYTVDRSVNGYNQLGKPLWHHIVKSKEYVFTSGLGCEWSNTEKGWLPTESIPPAVSGQMVTD